MNELDKIDYINLLKITSAIAEKASEEHEQYYIINDLIKKLKFKVNADKVGMP